MDLPICGSVLVLIERKNGNVDPFDIHDIVSRFYYSSY